LKITAGAIGPIAAVPEAVPAATRGSPRRVPRVSLGKSVDGACLITITCSTINTMTSAAAPDRATAEAAEVVEAADLAGSPVEAAVATARFFKVMSDPTRLAILRLLLERERSVGELVEILKVPQSRVSNHLACLRWCRFVDVARQSRKGIYRVADERLRAVLAEAETVSQDQCDHLVSCRRIGPAWI
jgi:ArsR family transcriptional regulator, cadmium/lead-responsive transcriptional repressor